MAVAVFMPLFWRSSDQRHCQCRVGRSRGAAQRNRGICGSRTVALTILNRIGPSDYLRQNDISLASNLRSGHPFAPTNMDLAVWTSAIASCVIRALPPELDALEPINVRDSTHCSALVVRGGFVFNSRSDTTHTFASHNFDHVFDWVNFATTTACAK